MKKKSKYQYLEQCTNRINLFNALDHLEKFFLRVCIDAITENRHLINKNITIGIPQCSKKDRFISTICFL